MRAALAALPGLRRHRARRVRVAGRSPRPRRDRPGRVGGARGRGPRRSRCTRSCCATPPAQGSRSRRSPAARNRGPRGCAATGGPRRAGWEQLGDPYERALELAESGEPAPTLEALRMLDDLGADAAVRQVRQRLRELGVTAHPAPPDGRHPRPPGRAHPAPGRRPGPARRRPDQRRDRRPARAVRADGGHARRRHPRPARRAHPPGGGGGGADADHRRSSVAPTDAGGRRSAVHCAHDRHRSRSDLDGARRRPVHRPLRQHPARGAGRAHRSGPRGADPAAERPVRVAGHGLGRGTAGADPPARRERGRPARRPVRRRSPPGRRPGPVPADAQQEPARTTGGCAGSSPRRSRGAGSTHWPRGSRS